MAVQKITIDEFLQLSAQHLVLDVRSPGEYGHAHIPGAYSLSLFTDEERKVVGTAYKQQSRQTAIKIGLDYFGVKMRGMVEAVEGLFGALQHKPAEGEESFGRPVIVHCWRGGMRSAGVAWLLDLYGFKVYTLEGGYKKFRQWARLQFDKTYPFTLIGGYSGSGKTLVLHQLQQLGKRVIDLEALANHRGSAFGALGEKPQPSQEMFENVLATELYTISNKAAGENVPIYLEDESQRIGLLNIPTGTWNAMRNRPVIFIDIPFEERLDHLTKTYGHFEKEKLVNAIIRIQKRLGGLETKTAINYLLEDDHKECFRVLLKYYDKCYGKALLNRNNLPALLHKISCGSVDINTITNLLIHEKANV